MEISIVSSGPTLLCTRHGNFELEWPTTSLWMKLSQQTTYSVYGPLNEYWGTLPTSLQTRYWDIYQEAFQIIESSPPFEVLCEELTRLVGQMFDLIDYPHLRQWVLSNGGIAYNQDIHLEYTGDYPRRQTYLKDEYDELVVMSFYFKMITPIWGKFLYGNNHIDSAYKEMVAYDLMATSGIHNIPAMDRFKDYCEAIAEKERKSLMPAICTYMGTNEIPRYFISIAVVRRVAIGEIRDPDKTLIKVVYKFLDSKSKNLSNGVRDKRAGIGDGDEKESVTERYRISNRIPDYSVVMMEVYSMDLESFVKALNPEGSVEKAQAYINMLLSSPRFTIADYHLPIVGLVCKRVIYPRSLRIIRDRDAYIHAIGITAGWLSDNGYQGIANMLIASRQYRDMDSDEGFGIGGLAMSTLTRDNKEMLDLICPFHTHDDQGRANRENPAVITINMIIAEVNTYEWYDRDVVPANFRNELAEIIIKLENQAHLSRRSENNDVHVK